MTHQTPVFSAKCHESRYALTHGRASCSERDIIKMYKEIEVSTLRLKAIIAVNAKERGENGLAREANVGDRRERGIS